MKREKSLIKNIFILGFGTVFPKLASLFTLPIITAILTKIEYGTYDLVVSMVSLFLPIATLQLQAAAFRFLLKSGNKKYDDDVVVTNITVFTILFSTIALIILFIATYKLSLILRLMIVAYYFFDTIVTTFRQFSRGLSKSTAYSSSVFIESIINFVLIYVFLKVLSYGLYGAMGALIISQILSIFYLLIKLKIWHYINIKKVSKGALKDIIAYSWPLIPNSLSSWVMSLSDRIVLTMTMGITANAIYSIANKLPNIFHLAQNSFTLAWQENASISVEDSDSEEYYSKMFNYVYRALVGILSLIIASTPILFKLLIRGDYNESYNHIPILFMGAFFSSVSAYFGGIYIAHKKSKTIGTTTIVAALINLTIDLVLVRFIGIYAASLSTLVSYFFLAMYRMKEVQKIQKINYNHKTIWSCIIILSLMCIATFLRTKYIDIGVAIFSFIFAIYINKEMISIIYKKLSKKKNSKK